MDRFWKIEESNGSSSPRWRVVRSGEIIARCYTQEDAKTVAAALNRIESDIHRGE